MGAAFLTGCGSERSEVRRTGGSLNGNQCLPVTQPLPFTGQNNLLYSNGYSSQIVIAGQVPPQAGGGEPVGYDGGAASAGTVTLGGGGGLGYGALQKSSAEGSLSISINNIGNQNLPPFGGGQYNPEQGGYSPSQVNLSGVATLSQQFQQLILMEMGYGVPGQGYPQAPIPAPGAGVTQVPCVSGLALQMEYLADPYSAYIIQAFVYLYINNTQSGYLLYL